MVKKSQVSALVLAMLLGSVSGMASAAKAPMDEAGNEIGVVAEQSSEVGFTADMSKNQIAAVVKEKLKAGKKLADIVAEAKSKGVNSADLKAALIAQGQDPVVVSLLVDSKATGSGAPTGAPVGTNSNNGNSNGTAGGGGASPV